MSRKCKKCGCKIVKDDNGLWKDPISSFPYSCESYWDHHIPEEKPKKARCAYCGRRITKKGKNWKDNTNVRRKYCFNDFSNLYRKHEPAE